MVKHRKHYTPEEKVSILRRYLVEKVPVSDLCQEQKLQPTVFYRCLKEFFENGAGAFQKESDRENMKGVRSQHLTKPAISDMVPNKFLSGGIYWRGPSESNSPGHSIM